MSSWPSAKARRVFAALKRIGWRHDRTVGSHQDHEDRVNPKVLFPEAGVGMSADAAGISACAT
jgi:predicted RNA binding protein YcfA (HicA-like mRNA interferase family)